MNSRNLTLSISFLFLSFQVIFALPSTPKTNEVSTTKMALQEKTISAKKTKKGLFKRIGQNFLAKRMKKMVAKHLGTATVIKDDVNTTLSTDIANADDQELKDAKLIGLLLGFLLGLFGVLGVVIFFKKGERKKTALRGAWLGVLILLALALLLAVL